MDTATLKRRTSSALTAVSGKVEGKGEGSETESDDNASAKGKEVLSCGKDHASSAKHALQLKQNCCSRRTLHGR